MDFSPPASVRQVGDLRWRRFVIRDGGGHYWTGQGWSDNPSAAMLFLRESDAVRVGLRLHKDGTERFKVNVIITVGKGEWTLEDLRKHLTAWGRFIVMKSQETRAVTVTIHWAGLEEDDGDDFG
jgi:hypothetical protein